MQTDKLGSFSWQSLGWIEMSVTVRGEDAHPSLPQEVSWSGSAGAGFGSDGWDGAVAGLLVGGRSPQPWGRGAGIRHLPGRAALGEAWRKSRSGAGLGVAHRVGRKPGLRGLPGRPEPALEAPQLPAFPYLRLHGPVP